MHYAAAENNVAMAQGLVESPIDINAKDDNEWTALHFAAQSNSFEVAKLLPESGAEIHVGDSFGNTPLSTAVFSYRGNLHKKSNRTLEETVSNLDYLGFLFVLLSVISWIA